MMESSQKTYRLFSMLMAILVAVSISLPSELLAVHCDMDTQQPSKNETIAEFCPHIVSSSSHARHNHQNKDDCNWTLSCACNLDQQQVTAEAIPTITKTTKVFVVSVIQYVDLVPTNTSTFFTDIEFSSHAEFPPIFLLNSVFLN